MEKLSRIKLPLQESITQEIQDILSEINIPKLYKEQKEQFIFNIKQHLYQYEPRILHLDIIFQGIQFNQILLQINLTTYLNEYLNLNFKFFSNTDI